MIRKQDLLHELTELAELSIAENQLSKSAEPLKRLVTVLLGSLLIDGCVGGGGVATRDLLCLPDEVLKKVALVLGKEKDLGLLDNIAEICNEVLTFRRELLGRTGQRLGCERGVQCHINLLVLHTGAS